MSSRAVRQLFAACAAAAFIAARLADAPAADYHVGPGQALAEAGDVPWESRAPGDNVFIHWRAAPYLSKWVLCRQGAPGAWITVAGVPGPAGELPVIDGNGATTRSQLNYWNENRGVIKIGGANTPPDTTPSYILVQNLEIRSARPPYGYTGRSGAAGTAWRTGADGPVSDLARVSADHSRAAPKLAAGGAARMGRAIRQDAGNEASQHFGNFLDRRLQSALLRASRAEVQFRLFIVDHLRPMHGGAVLLASLAKHISFCWREYF